jgi:hypothetical protein
MGTCTVTDDVRRFDSVISTCGKLESRNFEEVAV